MLRVALLFFICSLAWLSQASQLLPVADKSQGLQRLLLQFEHQGLRQHALLILGSDKQLADNHLLVVAHGYHPDPPNYGNIANGTTLRPGNYYRQWVEEYALAGFNVLVPDYRGHNNSQGFEYTHQAGIAEFPERHYADDLLAAIQAMQQHMPNGVENLVMIGHSMGSPIAFYAANQMSEQTRLVSLWSSAGYRFASPKKDAPVVPFIIHHGNRDKSTPLSNSDFYRVNFASGLIYDGIYNTENHMLTGADFSKAMAIDISHIRKFIQ